jgi:predicted anti-sigma-YlaC factor YlaD
MEHERVSERLSAFADGTLDPAERPAVEDHLGQCAECRRDLEALRRTLALMRQLPRPAAPAHFAQALRRRARKGALARQRLLRWIRIMVPWEAALVVLLVAVGGLCVFQLLTVEVTPVAAPAIEVADEAGLQAVAEAAWQEKAEVWLQGRRVPPGSRLMMGGAPATFEIRIEGAAWPRLRTRLEKLGHALPPPPAAPGPFVIAVTPRPAGGPVRDGGD